MIPSRFSSSGFLEKYDASYGDDKTYNATVKENDVITPREATGKILSYDLTFTPHDTIIQSHKINLIENIFIDFSNNILNDVSSSPSELNK